MDTKLMVTTITAVCLAFSGYVFTYVNRKRSAQRSEYLERINRQLAELYGPLFSLAHASKAAWDAFRSEHRPGKDFWDKNDPPTDQELQEWMLWVRTVFYPMTSRMYDLITNNSDLLIEGHMPDCLLHLCAHVTGYAPVIKKWDADIFSRYTSYVSYPANTLLQYAEESFVYLKRE